MAVHPLRPATDRRLGGPLPRQLANQTRTHPIPLINLTSESCDSKVSCGFNPGFPRLFLCIGQIVHALLTRPPLSIFRKTYFVRLACVRHAASVRPEPGSNSRLIFLLKITHSIIYLSLLFCLFFLFRTLKGFLCCFIV